MNVEFCNGRAFKIDAAELNEKVMVECEALFGHSLKRNSFPGPQPVAVELKDLKKLQDGYMVCEKTDGSRAILLLININNKINNTSITDTMRFLNKRFTVVNHTIVY